MPTLPTEDALRREISLLMKARADALFALADEERRKHCGDAVHLRGIIEFSNVCSRKCQYCGLRRDNTSLTRYVMTLEDILPIVASASAQGVRTIVLQSGENDSANPDELAEIIDAIKRHFDVAVTLCVGVKPSGQYTTYRRAGADRYLLKHEAASPRLYRACHPDSELAERLASLIRLKELGYQVGSGCIVGLPGQTRADLVEDLLLTSALDVDMAAFGPFVPHPHTPLADAAPGRLATSLRLIAVARLVLGPVHIPATTALDAIAPNGREKALQAGANVLMANLTPERRHRLYDLYPRRQADGSIRQVEQMLERLGRPLADDHGHSLKRPCEKEPCNERRKA